MVLNNLFTGHHWSSRQKIYTYGHGQMGGEDEMYGECTVETCVTVCKIDSNRNLLYGSGNSNRGSVSI